MQEPKFIGREVLDELHRESMFRFGGTMGVRDEGLIESALGAAQNTFFYANGDYYDIAASYAFHISQAQAFLDGNKRTAVAAALVFLAVNGCGFRKDDGRLYDAMIGIAEKRVTKSQMAQLFRRIFSGAV
ncbi:MAG: type II toxin-antitoxin system death-on-curing family toxin [Chthoniobacterales bacterium]